MPLEVGQEMELVRGVVRVTVENIGEGWDGDYQEDDPGDQPLVRFALARTDVDMDEEGDTGQFRDCCYCTQFPATATDEQLQKLLEYIMDKVYEPIMAGTSMKRYAEHLSWVSLEDVESGEWPAAIRALHEMREMR